MYLFFDEATKKLKYGNSSFNCEFSCHSEKEEYWFFKIGLDGGVKVWKEDGEITLILFIDMVFIDSIENGKASATFDGLVEYEEKRNYLLPMLVFLGTLAAVCFIIWLYVNNYLFR